MAVGVQLDHEGVLGRAVDHGALVVGARIGVDVDLEPGRFELLPVELQHLVDGVVGRGVVVAGNGVARRKRMFSQIQRKTVDGRQRQSARKLQ